MPLIQDMLRLLDAIPLLAPLLH